jgi:hypothetical protein
VGAVAFDLPFIFNEVSDVPKADRMQDRIRCIRSVALAGLLASLGEASRFTITIKNYICC